METLKEKGLYMLRFLKIHINAIYDYKNKDADWKNSRDAVQRGMQKAGSGYPADPPYKADLWSINKLLKTFSYFFHFLNTQSSHFLCIV